MIDPNLSKEAKSGVTESRAAWLSSASSIRNSARSGSPHRNDETSKFSLRNEKGRRSKGIFAVTIASRGRGWRLRGSARAVIGVGGVVQIALEPPGVFPLQDKPKFDRFCYLSSLLIR